MEMKNTHPTLPEYELIDPLLEEVGEVKLEIHRIHNRIGVIKAFYQHIRCSTNPTVRRELHEKVNEEAEIVSTTLTKVSEIFQKWTEVAGGNYSSQRKDLERTVFKYLKDVLNEYDAILNQHREISLAELQRMLKVTSTSIETEGKKSSAFFVDQTHLRTFDEEKHIEIEERYSQILQTDRILRMIKNKFGYLLDHSDFTDIAVLQLARILDRSQTQPSLESTNRKYITILAVFLSITIAATFIYILCELF